MTLIACLLDMGLATHRMQAGEAVVAPFQSPTAEQYLTALALGVGICWGLEEWKKSKALQRAEQEFFDEHIAHRLRTAWLCKNAPVLDGDTPGSFLRAQAVVLGVNLDSLWIRLRADTEEPLSTNTYVTGVTFLQGDTWDRPRSALIEYSQKFLNYWGSPQHKLTTRGALTRTLLNVKDRKKMYTKKSLYKAYCGYVDHSTLITVGQSLVAGLMGMVAADGLGLTSAFSTEQVANLRSFIFPAVAGAYMAKSLWLSARDIDKERAKLVAEQQEATYQEFFLHAREDVDQLKIFTAYANALPQNHLLKDRYVTGAAEAARLLNDSLPPYAAR